MEHNHEELEAMFEMTRQKELEAMLEMVRQKIADQGHIVDDRLLEKERNIKQLINNLQRCK